MAARLARLSVLSAALFEGSMCPRFTFDEIAAELRAGGIEEVMRVAAPYAHIIGQNP